MDNNRVGIFEILIIVLIIALAGFTYSNFKVLEHLDNDKIEKNNKLREIDEDIERLFDSINSVGNKTNLKKQEVYYNNTYIYQQENEKIANYSDSLTDSLFEQNLRTGYERFGWMLINK